MEWQLNKRVSKLFSIGSKAQLTISATFLLFFDPVPVSDPAPIRLSASGSNFLFLSAAPPAPSWFKISANDPLIPPPSSSSSYNAIGESRVPTPPGPWDPSMDERREVRLGVTERRAGRERSALAIDVPLGMTPPTLSGGRFDLPGADLFFFGAVLMILTC